MIRYGILIIAVIAIIGACQKNWFRGLCYLLPLLAFLERSDMPRQMFGITGMNPFNLLLFVILIAWLAQRKQDGSHWGADKTTTRLLIMYMGMVLISTIRGYMDYGTYEGLLASVGAEASSRTMYLFESTVNDFKWMIPGLLISVGATSEERIRMAINALLVTATFFSLLIISRMLPALIGGDDIGSRALRVLDRDLGYHRVALASITAGSAWAFLAAKPIINSRYAGMISLGGFGLCTIAMILTGGRGGMLAWVAAAVVFGFYRWRKLLFAAPVFAALAILFIPGLQERLLVGFSPTETEETKASLKKYERRLQLGVIDESGRDTYAITAGRGLVWPVVFDQAMEKPIVGHGRIAMYRSGVVTNLREYYGITSFGHPHNAYLELFLDMGLLGVLIVGAFYWRMLRAALRKFTKPANDLEYVVASIVLAFLIVGLTASLTAQSFYPKQGATLMWIALGLGFTWLLKSPAKQASKEGASRQAAARAPQLR